MIEGLFTVSLLMMVFSFILWIIDFIGTQYFLAVFFLGAVFMGISLVHLDLVADEEEYFDFYDATYDEKHAWLVLRDSGQIPEHRMNNFIVNCFYETKNYTKQEYTGPTLP